MQGFLLLPLKHVARLVGLWNQNNATSVQIKRCQSHINYWLSKSVNGGIKLDSLHYAAWL